MKKPKLPEKYNVDKRKDWMKKSVKSEEEKSSLKNKVMEKLIELSGKFNLGKITKEDMLKELIEIGKKVKAKKTVIEYNFDLTFGEEMGSSLKNRCGAWELAETFIDTKKDKK